MRPANATRCPANCPDLAPGCHNVNTCECWKKQMEEDAERHAAREAKYASKRKSWEERGIRV